MTTAASVDYSQYNGQKVVLTLVPEGESTEPGKLEGKVEVGNALGVLFKIKGKAQPELVEASRITGVEAAPEKPKELKAKTLKPVELGGVRAHLLERHGVSLDWANSVTEEQAKEYHDGLDHEALKLGHVHKAPEASTERDEAVAAAEAEVAQTAADA